MKGKLIIVPDAANYTLMKHKAAVTMVTALVALLLFYPVSGAAGAAPQTAPEIEIANLAAAAAQARQQLEIIEAELDRSNLEIIDAYQKLEISEKRLAEMQEAVNKRFRDLYKSGRGEILEFLLNYKSFTDFWSRMELLARVSSIDRATLTRRRHQLEVVKKLRNAVAAKKLDRIRLRRSKVKQVQQLQAMAAQRAQLAQILARSKGPAASSAKYLSEFALNTLSTP